MKTTTKIAQMIKEVRSDIPTERIPVLSSSQTYLTTRTRTAERPRQKNILPGYAATRTTQRVNDKRRRVTVYISECCQVKAMA